MDKLIMICKNTKSTIKYIQEVFKSGYTQFKNPTQSR